MKPPKTQTRPTAEVDEDTRVQVLVGGTQDRLLDLIQLERLARNLDPGERHLLADKLASRAHPAGIPVGSHKWADLLASVPEGRNYLWHTPRGGGEPLFGWRTRYWNFMLKLAKDQPSWTIQAQPGPATGPFHWRNRKLSAAELGRLQTLPDNLRYDCSRGEIQRLVGNAVPSALAEIIAREIGAQLLRCPYRSASLSLLPPARGAPPRAERVASVPRKYLPLSGNHADHPGTGKGRRATTRLDEAA